MARPISDEELQLKKRARRRLVGAVVLATAVAVILPMVLDSEPRSINQNVDIQIPSPDSSEFKPKSDAPGAPVIDSKSAAKSTPEKGAYTVTEVPPPASKAPSAPSAAAVTEPAAAAKETPKSEAPAAKKSAPDDTRLASVLPKDQQKADVKDKSPAAGGTYVVQVAALADPARVKLLQKQMTGAGVKTYTQVVMTQSGEVTRVRAGPYPTREAAEKARAQLKKAGLEGKVLPQ